MDGVVDGFWGAVGNTPLIRLRRASEATGCEILGKAEFMNPGGSVKDRAALGILKAAMAEGRLVPGQAGTIVEGTAGNTGIGIALAANALGWRSVIVVPETQSREKLDYLRMIGADLRLVPPKPASDPGHYVNVSRRLAEELGAVWANQFDNPANALAHEATTGPEIWDQTDGRVDAFTCACGTGGTLAGVARALKARKPGVRIVLADPGGSGLLDWVKTGTPKAEGSSITEGIGQAARAPGNLAQARDLIDDAVRIEDPAMLEQVFDLQMQEGISVGGSAGLNVAAAIRVARDLGPGHTVVTILCDGAARYQSKLFNPAFLRGRGLPTPPWMDAAG
ncbi:cysteine synthase A [Falsiroseomonas selenitidurans]|uniref:Cysteine synthase A n=1 Tax=Falsiroseomonas selenitidurans TaxID=2716335 RepID=A0ABX1DZH5_9PROT|nr:cysteine synthase A [Falsiroseomonas selenitidurans]NKC30256.1 cysteine synthase A [Falsiroseomonas selenitidurans]OYW07817.1 MAG: cysteine synthase A [Rhodospirillales bacterium 12-71-4]